VGGDTWVADVVLRFSKGGSKGGSGSGLAKATVPLEWPNGSKDFNGPAYNANRTVSPFCI
jgi:hypothetical protein